MKKINAIIIAKVFIYICLVVNVSAQKPIRSNINNTFDFNTNYLHKNIEKIKEFHNSNTYIIDTIQNSNNAFLQFSNRNLKKINQNSRPKVTLPFYVYKEGDKLPYTPSGLMGNYKDLKVETKNKKDSQSGTFSMKISYNSNDNWFGVAMVNPANDWGDIDGGYDVSGAKTYSFWAKASEKNVKAKIGFGMIGKDKKYPDTAKLEKEFKLSTKWKKYSFNLKKLDLSRIRTGFVLFSGGIGKPYEIFIDDVVFE